MVEAMVLRIATSVLEKLSSPALKEALLLWNFEKDLKKLGETIETITCFIYDAEQRQSKERVVKLWMSRLKAVLYEADDLFDTIDANGLHKKAIGGSKFEQEVTLFFSPSNQLSFVIKTAHDIKDIRERLDGIKDDMSSFQFQYRGIEEKGSHVVLEREERHSFVDDMDVIGRDHEKEDIISLLLSEDRKQQNLEVISVIGFGGLGKTTLTQLVYNDEMVQGGFDMCLWSCINYLCDLQSVLENILMIKQHTLHLDHLQKELREKIQGKKYLLVLDDVWDENASNWGKLKTLLNCGKAGSKVLITTRKTKVAQCLDATEPYYRLNTLSEESAWSLFVKMAFKDGGFDGDSELALVGKMIVRKCGYVPLALSMIGRTLRYRKKDKEEWLSFLEKEFAGVVSSDVDDGDLMQVLKVSFNDLPLALKHCFAYCSVFPKDHKFEKDELIRMWIAQGFVGPHAKKSLEEVGNDYFFYMVDRCLFQEVIEYEPDFDVVWHTCKMHDLLHDLVIQVAELESNSISDKELSEIVDRNTSFHHISITLSPNSSFDFSNSSSLSKSLRTLRFVDAKHIKINSLELLLDRFRKLRTLVLQYMMFETLPEGIFDELIHLRYLDLLENVNLIALPNSVCKLYHLKTLVLTDCYNLVTLPSKFEKLVSLRHLFLERCWKLDSMPSGFATLTTLASLDRFVVHPDHGGLRYLGLLDELCGTLKLELPTNGWMDCVEDAKQANMRSKCRLRGLSIECSEEFGEREMSGEERKAVIEELQPHVNLEYLQIEYYIGDKLPSWFSSLSNIKKLSLQHCGLEYLDISVRCIYLSRLEVLALRDIPRLRGWWRDDPPISTVVTLPRVSKLRIERCTNLVESMPVFEAVQELIVKTVNVRLVNMLLSNPTVKLEVLHLERVEGLECLSEGSIMQMTALKSLEIHDCENLSWVSRRGLACLASLEELSILCCGGVRLEDEDDRRPYSNINNDYGLQILHHLEMPWQCHFLREERHFLSSLQTLHIEYYEEKQVETDNQDMECCTTMWYQGFNKLERVQLSFKRMACCFPNWVLQLPFLKSLSLLYCGEMNVDDWAAQQIQPHNLEYLDIRLDKELLWVHDIPWDLFPSLITLQIDSPMSSIPPGIQQLASLRSLRLWSRRGIKEIPKWMMNSTSLQELRLGNCSYELKARCEPETGADWHLISHIPSINIT